jgi:archaeal flagellin FlaB
MNKKAEMGIGTLIIFIALLLVAAIAAGVLIQTSGSLQEKALTTGDQAKGQIATNVRVVEVSATDGSAGYLNDFQQIVKLAPGSDAIKLSQVLFTMNTFDKTATLKYRGVNGTYTKSNTGFNTYNLEEVTGTAIINISETNYTLAEDYDDDGLDDLLYVINTGEIVFDFSTATDYTIPLATADCSGDNDSIQTTIPVNNDQIETIVLDIWCGDNAIYLANSSGINITPQREGQGYFSVEYLQRGANPVAGNLQRGDVIKLYYEAPKNVGEDENIRINFIPKIGTPTLTEFITPEVISTERVYLYP